MNNTTCPQCFGTGIKPDDRDVGSQLRAIRRKAGLRLADIANLAGCTISHVSDIENGKRHCSPRIRQAYDDIMEEGGVDTVG